MSTNRDRRRTAHRFLEHLADQGWLLLLCWHQLEELIQHRDDHLVDDRIQFLRSLPLIAWVGAADPAAGPGSILDILSAEVAAAFEEPAASALNVRDRARDRLLRFGPGGEAVPAQFQDWRALRPALQQRQKRSMEVVAISRAKVANIDDTRLADWLKMPLRAPADARAQFANLRGEMTTEIAQRGDKRIADPAAVADVFYSSIELEGPQHLSTVNGEHAALAFLRAAGLDSEDLDPEAKLGDLMDLATFRKKLRLVAGQLRAPWSDLKRVVTMERLPVAVIENSIRAYGQDNPERKGSDLTDVHLLCLAPYADMTYVDKRTMENLTRARRKVPLLAPLTGTVAKASGYHEIQTRIPPP